MTEELKTLEGLREKVESFLRNKELSYEVRPEGDFWLRQGSTLVVISPNQWEERTLVRLASPVAINVTDVSPELTKYLVEMNHQLLFGKFALDTEGKTIWYEHVLLGDFLNEEELFVGLAAVALTADDFDEKVSEMAGGKRVSDLKKK
ncbi:MAG: YbjN domain-containing protein [Thermoplasmata archaeon]|nr:MAG: YbjN domain-containing protein [Thermoplasmata archaeon]